MKFTKEQRRQWLDSLEKRASSAAVIIEDELGRVLCLKSDYKTHWALPGGVIDAGESPIEAVIRETKEEINFDLDTEDLRPLMTACRKGDIISYQFIFLARIPSSRLSIATMTLQDSEIQQARFFTKDEIRSGDYPLLWAVRAYAEGKSGYFETEIPEVYNGAKEVIQRNKTYEQARNISY